MRIEEKEFYQFDKEISNLIKTELQIEDIKESIITFLDLQRCLYKKQIQILIRNSRKIGCEHFFNHFVEKYGIPKEGERGFSANCDMFINYFIEDVINSYKKPVFNHKKINEQINFLEQNPSLKKGLKETLRILKNDYDNIKN